MSLSLLQAMTSLDKWGMDVFTVSELTNGKPLTAIAYAIFRVSDVTIFMTDYYSDVTIGNT